MQIKAGSWYGGTPEKLVNMVSAMPICGVPELRVMQSEGEQQVKTWRAVDGAVSGQHLDGQLESLPTSKNLQASFLSMTIIQETYPVCVGTDEVPAE